MARSAETVPSRRDGVIGFIHIGKTGGAALRTLLALHQKRTPDANIRVFGHQLTLPEFFAEFPNGRIIFFVRDPISRFVSAFNSRLRRGRPRFNAKWSKDEAIAFRHFGRPVELAEALSADDPRRRAAAEDAMLAIRHVRRGLSHYLVSVDTLEVNKARIFLIGAQETFEQDVAILKKKLKIDEDLFPPADDVNAHRTPTDMDRTMSDLGAANLHKRLENEYRLYEWCLAYRQEFIAP